MSQGWMASFPDPLAGIEDARFFDDEPDPESDPVPLTFEWADLHGWLNKIEVDAKRLRYGGDPKRADIGQRLMRAVERARARAKHIEALTEAARD